MFQSYTIRSLDQNNSTSPDIDQYKMLNVKEKPLDNRQAYLDVMCFPNLFPLGHFGELHTREVHISSFEYAKSKLLKKDSRFRKDAQYVFFLLSQQQQDFIKMNWICRQQLRKQAITAFIELHLAQNFRHPWGTM